MSKRENTAKKETVETSAVEAAENLASQQGEVTNPIVNPVPETAKEDKWASWRASLAMKSAQDTLTLIPPTEEEIAAAKKEGKEAKGTYVAIRKDVTNEELVKIGEEAATDFESFGLLDDELTSKSAALYSKYAVYFPVKNGTNGHPDVNRFINSIWDIVPAAKKPLSPTVAGKYLTAESASKERNQIAKGLINLKRWINRNKATLFPHLGVQKTANEAKVAALNKVENSMKAIAEFFEQSGNLDKFKFVMVDEKGNPTALGDKDEPMTLKDIFGQLSKMILEKEKAEAKGIIDAARKEAEEKLKKEEKENQTPEEKKESDYHGEEKK